MPRNAKLCLWHNRCAFNLDYVKKSMDWKAKKETSEWLCQLLMFNVTVFTFSFEHFHAKCIHGFIKLGEYCEVLCWSKLMFEKHNTCVVLTLTLIAAGRPPLLIQGCSSTSSRRWSEEKCGWLFCICLSLSLSSRKTFWMSLRVKEHTQDSLEARLKHTA